MSRSGGTFEANLGFGLIWASAGDVTSDTQTGLAGLDVGLGGWITDYIALSVRIAGATFSPADGVQFTTGFVGPSLQIWGNDHFWIGAGAGLGFAAAQIDGASQQPSTETGLGLDFRAGVTFNPESHHTVNLSIEVNPGFFSVDSGSGGRPDVKITSLGLLLGYQYL